MKANHFLPGLILSTFLLSNCSSTHTPSTNLANNLNRQSVTLTTAQNYPAKNPKTVTIYTTTQSPQTAYRVIGVAKVSKYNLMGMQRQETTITDMMKHLAASIGGDGLMNITNHDDHMQANVIAFEKILI